jgi:phage-related baseplate assembly protein
MLGGALRDGAHGLSSVPSLLRQVLEEESWREFVTQRGERISHARFAEFVTTPPLAGLGATVKLVKKVVDAIEDDAERATVQDLLDRALQDRPGGDRRSDQAINRNNVPPGPAGNTRDQALRRLRKDAPELHSEVLAGRLSAHGAMVKAGYRPKTATVRVDSPEKVAEAIRRLLSPDEIAKVVALLMGVGSGPH